MHTCTGLDLYQEDLAGAILLAMQPDGQQYDQIRAGIIDVVKRISPEQIQVGINIFYMCMGDFYTFNPNSSEEGRQWYIRTALQTV